MEAMIEKDTDIVRRTLIDSTAGNTELDIRTPYVIRDMAVPTRMRVPLYDKGKLIPAKELKKLGLTVREYTRLEVDTEYYAQLYAQDAAGDGALALRVRQYKAHLDQLQLPYDSPQDTIVSAIQASPLSDNEKTTLAITMKTVYDAITTNLEALGSASPHIDTYSQLAKLIRYLPQEA